MVRDLIARFIRLWKPKGPGIEQWKSWLGHSAIATLIALVLKLAGIPAGYAATIAISMYSGREIFSTAEEWFERKKIDRLDHFMDAFSPLVAVLTVFGLAGWL